MVELTALDGQKLVINENLIERIEARPDTILSLTSGRKLIVRESVRELLELLEDCRRVLMRDNFPFSMAKDDAPRHALAGEPA